MMSSLRFLTAHLLGGSLLLLLLTAVCEAQYYGDTTLPPEYDSDYNSTFEYSFFSNSSSEDLDRFLDKVIENDSGDEEVEVVEEEISFTTAAPARTTTERSKKGRGGSHGGAVGNSASLPVCLELRKLLWTSMILMVLNSQQL
ncbi:uncharacterized protein FYW61_013158 [Anableps anableps]